MNAQPIRRGRVLIVDDETDILEGMKALLEIEGIDVITHDSMITLPLILRDADPDVILLDIGLPALSGSALLNLGRKRLLRTDATVILFSGRSARELDGLAHKFGADGFVTKSQDPMEIVARVQTWIGQRRAQRAAEGKGVSNVSTSTASPAAR